MHWCRRPLLKYAFFHFIFLLLYQNQVFVGVWMEIQIFDFVPLVLLSVFVPIPGCFQYCSSVVEFEVRDCDASRSSFIIQDCFGYPGVFCFSVWSWVLFFQLIKTFSKVAGYKINSKKKSLALLYTDDMGWERNKKKSFTKVTNSIKYLRITHLCLLLRISTYFNLFQYFSTWYSWNSVTSLFLSTLSYYCIKALSFALNTHSFIQFKYQWMVNMILGWVWR